MDLLRSLFDKTIEFFETAAQPSSSLTHDMNILKGLRSAWDAEEEAARSEHDRATTSSTYSTSVTPGPNPPTPAPPGSLAPNTPSDSTLYLPPPTPSPYGTGPVRTDRLVAGRCESRTPAHMHRGIPPTLSPKGWLRRRAEDRAETLARWKTTRGADRRRRDR